jgi:hypothetical protein
MPSITDPQVRAFLTEGTRTGKLSFRAPAEEFGQRNGGPGELVVRVRPTKVLASFNVTG